jgi:hypothetical protein
MNRSHGEGLVNPQGPIGAGGPIVDDTVGGSEGGAFAVSGDDGLPAEDVVAVVRLPVTAGVGTSWEGTGAQVAPVGGVMGRTEDDNASLGGVCVNVVVVQDGSVGADSSEGRAARVAEALADGGICSKPLGL